MEWIDSHCHLRACEAAGGLDGVLERAAAAGVRRVVTVGTSPGDWAAYREMRRARPGVIDYTVGLHPGEVDEGWEDAVAQISAFFTPPAPPVALGEIGLDHFHLPKDPVAAGEVILRQEAAFRRQLMLADELGCPVVVHSRQAFEETVALVDESGIDWSRVVFHCFSYGPDAVAALRERGGRASFTGIVTYKNASEVRRALARQGPGVLMVETDSPYLSPEPHRGKTNEPARVADVGRACAEALGMDPAELAARSSANARGFFGLR